MIEALGLLGLVPLQSHRMKLSDVGVQLSDDPFPSGDPLLVQPPSAV